MKYFFIMKPRYIWSKKTNNELQLWPTKSTEHYITSTAVQPSEINRGGLAVKTPPPLVLNLLEMRGILYSATTSHKRGYHQSVRRTTFNGILYTAGGSCEIKFGNRSHTMRRGSVLILPKDNAYEINVTSPQGWNLFWFCVDDTKRWNKIFRDKVVLRKAKYIRELGFIVKIYLEEVYSENPSIGMIQAYSDIIENFIRREILGKNADNAGSVPLENLMAKVRESPDKNWTVKSAAKELGASAKEFGTLFYKNYQMTFSKLLLTYRMEKAFELLKTTEMSLKEIAKATGYSGAFSFSRTFKAHFKKSPLTIRK